VISVISCSIDPVKAASIERHYHELLADEPHEFIGVMTPRSLAEGYNAGIDASCGEIVILSHDDIEFLDQANWLPRLKAHMAKYDMIGLAGTTKLVSPAWAQAGPPYTFGQVGETNDSKLPFRVLLCAVPAPAVVGIQAVDGLFMTARRQVLDRVRFDAQTFNGFHVYDIDFSFSVFLEGFHIAVATDLPVLHYSQGDFNQEWRRHAQSFRKKRGDYLSKFRHRPFQHAVVCARTKDELLEIMNGPRRQWCPYE